VHAPFEIVNREIRHRAVISPRPASGEKLS